MFDVKDIKKIYQLFEGSDVGEIEIEAGELKIRIDIGKPVLVQSNSLSVDVIQSNNQTEKTPTVKFVDSVSELRSNWVGFFTRLNPSSGEYYVKLRDNVKKGDVIGHVRVLGVLQDIRSEVNGKIKEILIEEGQPIEYGQPIIRFEI